MICKKALEELEEGIDVDKLPESLGPRFQKYCTGKNVHYGIHRSRKTPEKERFPGSIDR